MTKTEVVQHLKAASDAGTLLIPKHDPNQLTTMQRYRSVLSYELANNLEGFFQSGEYQITEYVNTQYPASPIYLVFAPNSGSTFSVPGSGVLANSPVPTTPLDRIIAVSGQSLGWHVYAESSAKIAQQAAAAQLQFVNSY